MARLELLIGTRNPGKIQEIQSTLGYLPLRLRLLADFPHISIPNENGSTYEENALIKARAYSQQTGLLALADDSGLEVDQLNGAPGISSARYAGDGASDAESIRLLLSNLSRTGDSELLARFVCVMVIADLRPLKIAVGTCEGRIADQPRGENGFGFDPIFVPTNYSSTFAELPAEIKNSISHRARALVGIRQFLNDLLALS
ncbi:MAG TPA: RdgB/HAM1 family non-canonical purine NTP pyrophosphatase [Pyrinomonadaceae bacterium]|nr:RdgB/HAM1 family non-canonical purine NTP pyrophosphatase [Pyrinomonadaceae bacterium]